MIPLRATHMINSRQQAYLDALEIEVWCLREPAITSNSFSAESSPIPAEAEQAPGLKLGPGGGGVLLICEADSDSASRLANDISRALGSVPVWAWPHAEDGSTPLNRAVEENLFTTVAIFGEELAGQFFDGELPAALDSAQLVLLPSMQDLQTRAEARQQLWEAFCRFGMVGSH